MSIRKYHNSLPLVEDPERLDLRTSTEPPFGPSLSAVRKAWGQILTLDIWNYLLQRTALIADNTRANVKSKDLTPKATACHLVPALCVGTLLQGAPRPKEHGSCGLHTLWTQPPARRAYAPEGASSRWGSNAEHWNQIEDEEGIKTMRELGVNMAWLLKKLKS